MNSFFKKLNYISCLIWGDFGRKNDFLIPIGVDISLVALETKKSIEENKNKEFLFLQSGLMIIMM